MHRRQKTSRRSPRTRLTFVPFIDICSIVVARKSVVRCRDVEAGEKLMVDLAKGNTPWLMDIFLQISLNP